MNNKISFPLSNVGTPIELFFDQLRDLYSMEVQICDSMPELLNLCTNEKLRDLISSHARQNDIQVGEIMVIFDRHGIVPGNEKCKAIAGLIEGGTAHLNAVPCPHTRDLMMIAHCLRIEYYEIAAYKIATILSWRLGLTHEPSILSGLLGEEKEMASELMRLEPTLFDTADYHLFASGASIEVKDDVKDTSKYQRMKG